MMNNNIIINSIVILITLVVIGFFLVRKRANSSIKNSDNLIAYEYGIPMTEQETEMDRQSNEEILKLLEVSISASGFFMAEKIPELISKLREGYTQFGRVNTKIAFDGDVILTVAEKKALGLNTRMKYSKKFIECFDPSAFKMIEPKSTLEYMHLDAFYRVSRKNELLKLKKLGFVKKVKIVPDDDCGRIKRFKKIYNIEEVPELPLTGCDAPFCRCYYEAIIPNDV